MMSLALALSFISGPLHDIIGEKFNKFPGREVDVNATAQFLGGSFMEAEEYDELIGRSNQFYCGKGGSKNIG